MDNVYAVDAQLVLAQLKTSEEKGLSQQEAQGRLLIHGRNELPAPEATPFLVLVLKQFEDLLVIILLAAAVISFVLALFEDSKDRLTAFVEPAVILLILVANAIVGVVQETNAEKSIEALRQGEARDARVLRDGKISTIHASQLVPGDIIELQVGAKVPADGRVLSVRTATFAIDESALTGESSPSHKHNQTIKAEHAVAAEQHNCVFSGTLVVRGIATVVVTATGANTQIGRIAESLDKNDEEVKTPLQEKLDEFGYQLSVVIAVICVVVWLINVNHFTDPEHGGWVRGAIYYFKIAVALAVAAIPEGLPAVVTTCLALGTMKMAKKNAVVRSLPSVETLGCTTVICSDKTGTLTTNKMSARHVLTVHHIEQRDNPLVHFKHFSVEGDSFRPMGKVTDSWNKEEVKLPAVEYPTLAEVCKICTLCNEAELQFGRRPQQSGVSDFLSQPEFMKTGTPTEAALKVLAEKLGVPERSVCQLMLASDEPSVRINAAASYWRERYHLDRILEFTRERMSMSVLMSHASTGQLHLFVKGAPESVLNRCTTVIDDRQLITPLTKSIVDQINQQLSTYTAQGLRCIALAYSEDPVRRNVNWDNLAEYRRVESNLTFVGIVGVLDPPRQSIEVAIEQSRRAGIRLIVLTGDHKVTAESICRRIGVFGPDEDTTNLSFTGAELSAMSPREAAEAARTARLFARVTPQHKLQLVNILKRQGEVVAMTGDGVNDATALQCAHIGIAMGSGTDVAREASDMVLQDDNFATIVMAVEEGRAIYANTKQFIRYLISSNIGEVACIFFTAAIGMPEALIPVQLLWVNLVTDGLPATALGFNPPDADVMNRPPRDRGEGIVNGWMFFRYMVIGLYIGVATVIGFIWWYLYCSQGPHVSYAQLTHFHSCGQKDSQYFDAGFECSTFHDARPSTISLSVLVTVEMFNTFNALSENQSLLSVPPWTNPWAIAAITLSFLLHFMIVYVPALASIFHVQPLSSEEWLSVLALSFPVIVLDEILKFITRHVIHKAGPRRPSSSASSVAGAAGSMASLLSRLGVARGVGRTPVPLTGTEVQPLVDHDEKMASVYKEV